MMCISYNIGGGGGSGLDYVILLSEGGWVLITVDYGGGRGVKKCQKFDYVICERPPSSSCRCIYLPCIQDTLSSRTLGLVRARAKVS